MFCHAKYSGKPCKYWGVRDRLEMMILRKETETNLHKYVQHDTFLEMMILRKETETFFQRFLTVTSRNIGNDDSP